MTSAARWDLVDVSCTSGVAPGTPPAAVPIEAQARSTEYDSVNTTSTPYQYFTILWPASLPVRSRPRGEELLDGDPTYYYGKQARICFSNYRKSLDALIPKDAVGLPSPTYAGTDAAQLPASC